MVLMRTEACVGDWIEFGRGPKSCASVESYGTFGRWTLTSWHKSFCFTLEEIRFLMSNVSAVDERYRRDADTGAMKPFYYCGGAISNLR